VVGTKSKPFWGWCKCKGVQEVLIRRYDSENEDDQLVLVL
jgi:hypothetical protein